MPQIAYLARYSRASHYKGHFIGEKWQKIFFSSLADFPTAEPRKTPWQDSMAAERHLVVKRGNKASSGTDWRAPLLGCGGGLGGIV